MHRRDTRELAGTLLDDQLSFTLLEVCQVCRVHAELIIEMVDEGVLEPRGTAPNQWRFSGNAVTRAQKAVKLARDLRVNWPGAALAFRGRPHNCLFRSGAPTDLLEEIERLQWEARQRSSRSTYGRNFDR